MIGAGSMGRTRRARLHRAGAAEVVVVNRTPERAERLAAAVAGRGAGLGALPEVLADADVVVSCTGSVGVVVDIDTVTAAMADRPDRPLFVLDLALPHDVDPAVRALPAVTMTDLDDLRAVLAAAETADDVAEARAIVAEEVGAHLATQRAEPGGARPSSRCAPRPPRSSTPSCCGCRAGCPSSTSGLGSRSRPPYAASSTSCCTRRPCG